jgi:cytochrome c nitrite reductase small subunit
MNVWDVVRSPVTGLLVLAAVVGVAAGVGAYTFVYARGASYMTDNPAACANCHIMDAHYSTWLSSSHRTAAVCNDCHTPPGLIPKYANKASNGFWHSFAFTTGRHPDPIQIKPHNRQIAEQNCRRCHEPIVAMIDPHPGSSADRLDCIRCHSEVGHME